MERQTKFKHSTNRIDYWLRGYEISILRMMLRLDGLL